MEVSGNNNTVYHSTTVNTSIENSNSFNQANQNYGGCIVVVGMIATLIVLAIGAAIILGVYEFWNFLLSWVM